MLKGVQAIQYTKLGRSDLTVSRICMGSMGFGNATTGQHSWTVDEAQTREIIKRDLDLGINFARVAELADRRGVSMTEISLAWLLTKVTAPVVGATKLSHVEGAARAVELALTPDEIDYLEELYVPHALVGVMAQNGKQKAGNVV